jgi:hypothetical protein
MTMQHPGPVTHQGDDQDDGKAGEYRKDQRQHDVPQKLARVEPIATQNPSVVQSLSWDPSNSASRF